MSEETKPKKSKMFDFGQGPLRTWNPIRMKRCSNECYNRNGKTGCWSNRLREGKLKRVYGAMTKPLELLLGKKHRTWKEGEKRTIFVGSMCEIFLPCVPTQWLQQIMDVIRQNPQTTFLLVTKMPNRMLELLKEYGPNFFPQNVVFGITIESNRDYPQYGHGEPQSKRLAVATLLSYVGLPVFLSIEPILEFDLKNFTDIIEVIQPSCGVAIGYDNYATPDNHMIEPSLEKTLKLIDSIKALKIEVHKKGMREAY